MRPSRLTTSVNHSCGRLCSTVVALTCLSIVVVMSVGCWAQSRPRADSPRDPVAQLLQALGHRGVNVDAELTKLNALTRLRRQPRKARTLYASVKASLEAKLARAQSVPLPNPDNTLITRLAAGGLRILVVTAHPDDENMMSGLLAFARDHRNSVRLLCLTRGEAGEGFDAHGRGADLGRLRARELHTAALVLNIDVEIAGFPNGAFKKAFPGQTFWLPDEVLAAWRNTDDPVQIVRRVAARYAPDLVVTIEPNWGWTGNPEHRAAAALAGHAAHQTAAQLVYAVMADTPHTDRFDTTRFSPQRGDRYWAIKLSAARQHRSQYRLPPHAERYPERFPNLAVEHFQRAGFP